MMITSILQYSTIDYRFLKANLEQLSKFSDEIIVPVCDHLFNGELENRDSLIASYELLSNYEGVQIIEFQWVPGYTIRYWHNVARTIGIKHTSETADWVLFIDTDEIVDSSAFNEWLNTQEHDLYDSIKLSNYWYFREPIYQSTIHEDSVVMVRKKYAQFDLMHPVAEREQCHEFLNVPKKREVKGVDGLPMVHHYSWVRSKEEMLRKVTSWGHSTDKNWVELVEEEFSRSFNGTDFVHGYEYNIVDNKFNL